MDIDNRIQTIDRCNRIPPECLQIFLILTLPWLNFSSFGLKQQLSKIDNSSLNTIHSARNCGFIFDENLTFSDQSSSLSTSCDSPSLPPLSTLNLTTVTMYYNLPKSQINRLQQIQNCLARTVVKAHKSSHITPILRSLHWLKISERIEYKKPSCR